LNKTCTSRPSIYADTVNRDHEGFEHSLGKSIHMLEENFKFPAG